MYMDTFILYLDTKESVQNKKAIFEILRLCILKLTKELTIQYTVVFSKEDFSEYGGIEKVFSEIKNYIPECSTVIIWDEATKVYLDRQKILGVNKVGLLRFLFLKKALQEKWQYSNKLLDIKTACKQENIEYEDTKIEEPNYIAERMLLLYRYLSQRIED